jgi:hypothetical protein
LPINDFDSTNNTLHECYPVRASFDPNEKWITPEVADTSVHEFTYTIVFQNTGTAPASNICIIDTLDSDLKISSFEIIGASHEVSTQIFPGNILRFYFNSINLPDSTNDEPNSHGFVKYRISRKTNTGAGTMITNTAYIYFDYNAPVVTNTTSVVISSPVGINDIASDEISIYPNPSHNFISISSKNVINEITVDDIFGNQALSQSFVDSTNFGFSLEKLHPGVYFISIKDSRSNMVTVKKVVVY